MMMQLRLKCCILLFSLIPMMKAVSKNDYEFVSGRKRNIIVNNTKHKTPMHKVQMTQRGYIQFLRWELPVPEITEFTFCLWIQSSNLTYAHSFFSYSKNERDSLVRSWISPNGQSVHLEIAKVNIFTLRTFMTENQWYHICQSWENAEGRYAMWIDGRIVVQGHAPQMIGHIIPSNGDIVVGQEYTDFDKGLEDGIEGAVLGFNLLLASSFDLQKMEYEENESSIDNVNVIAQQHNAESSVKFGAKLDRVSQLRRSDSTLDKDKVESTNKRDTQTHLSAITKKTPLGLQLVEISYEKCGIGRGSPFIGNSLLLISWTRTPVRIFGGAILKNVNENCGYFTPFSI